MSDDIHNKMQEFSKKYRVENNNLDTNDIAEESASKQSLGSRMASGISKANQLRHDYQNAGGLTGMTKNAINDKIHDKIVNRKTLIFK